jgi:hypothetical protein
MKKSLLFLLAALIVVPAFGSDNWDGKRRSAITLDLAPLFVSTFTGGVGISVGYEYAPFNQFGIKLNGHFFSIDDPSELVDGAHADSILTSFRLSLEGRWYFSSRRYARGLFTNGGFQFQRLDGTFSIDGKQYGDGYNALGFILGLGYKAVIGRNRSAFVLEPTFDYVWPLYSKLIYDLNPSTANNVSWLLGIRGFRFGLNVGVAF